MDTSKKIISKIDYRICRKSKKFIYVESLKNTLKDLGHSIKGLKKPELLKLLDNIYLECDNDNEEPFVNEIDFLTFDPINSLDRNDLISIKENGKIYGFQIDSFKKLLESQETPSNPFTMNPIDIVEISKNKDKLDRYVAETDTDTISFTDTQLFNMKVLEIFQKIDALEVVASGTQISWFHNMSHKNLINFYLILQDIWNYRSQLNFEQKHKIVPENMVLNIYGMNVNKYPIEKKRELQHIILDDINKLVSSGISINEKKTGAYFVLIAFTEISPEAANEMPWLVQH